MDILLASARSELRFAMEVLLREQPGMVVVGTTTGTEALLALIETTCPDLVIFDWDLPGRPPADLLAAACAFDCPPYVIVVGRGKTSQQAALGIGADAFVLRGDAPDRLLAAIQAARSQRTALKDQIPTKTKGE